MYVYSAFNDNVFVYDRKYPSYYFQRKTSFEKGILVSISIYIIVAFLVTGLLQINFYLPMRQNRKKAEISYASDFLRS